MSLIKLNFSAIGWVYAENYPLYTLEVENGETYHDLTQPQLLELSQRLNLDLRAASR